MMVLENLGLDIVTTAEPSISCLIGTKQWCDVGEMCLSS